nr:Chain C, GLY-THR-GLY-GLY-SER-THR-GLY-THR-THR-SER-ALA-GLY [Porphyromonas gingivalis W83]
GTGGSTGTTSAG